MQIGEHKASVLPGSDSSGRVGFGLRRRGCNAGYGCATEVLGGAADLGCGLRTNNTARIHEGRRIGEMNCHGSSTKTAGTVSLQQGIVKFFSGFSLAHEISGVISEGSARFGAAEAGARAGARGGAGEAGIPQIRADSVEQVSARAVWD